MDTVWLAEAYPWWRKHGMEARSSTVVSALMARETKRLTIGWGIISPFTRHPVQVAMDARVVQEAAGPGRFLLGFGTSKIFLNNIRSQTSKTLGPMRDAVAIVRGVLGGDAFEYEGDTWSASVPGAAGRRAHAARRAARLRRRHGAEDAGPGRRDRGRLPDAVDHDAGLRALHPRERRCGHRHRLHGRRVDSRHRSRRGARRSARDRRDVPREQGAEHPGRGGRPARPRRDRAGGDQPGRRGDGARRAPRGEGRGERCAPRQVQADRRYAFRLHRGDRGVPRRRLHAHHARALGRRPPRADPAVRRKRVPATLLATDGAPLDDRPGPARGHGEPDGRHPELHGQRAGDGRVDGLALRGAGLRPQWQQVEDGRANALGTLDGRGRREEPDVQRAHGHVVLGPRALASSRPGLPAAGVRRGRAALRPRDLEHEGRARLLRRGRTRAPRRRGPPRGRSSDRGGVRGDREGPAGRRGRRRVPRLCRRHAAPRDARRRRGHVPARRADGGEGRARALRLALAADPGPRRLHPHGVQRGPARPERDPPPARRRSRRCRSGFLPGRTTRRTRIAAQGRSSTSAQSRRVSAGASRGRRTTRTCSSTSACRPRSRWPRHVGRCSKWCAASRSGSPTSASRAKST